MTFLRSSEVNFEANWDQVLVDISGDSSSAVGVELFQLGQFQRPQVYDS